MTFPSTWQARLPARERPFELLSRAVYRSPGVGDGRTHRRARLSQRRSTGRAPATPRPLRGSERRTVSAEPGFTPWTEDALAQDCKQWTAQENADLQAITSEIRDRSEHTCEWCGGAGKHRESRKLELTLCDACNQRFPDPPYPVRGCFAGTLRESRRPTVSSLPMPVSVTSSRASLREAPRVFRGHFT